MIGDESLAAFERTNMAWLSHEGELVTSKLFGHFDTLEGVPLFEEAYRRYRDTCDENADFVQRDLDALGPDEHPAMHRFSGMDDDARGELIKTVYTAGWIRLGRAFGRHNLPVGHPINRKALEASLGNRSFWYVEAEGLTESVRAHARTLRDIADRLGSDLVHREMKYEIVNMGSKSRPRNVELLVPEAFVQPHG